MINILWSRKVFLTTIILSVVLLISGVWYSNLPFEKQAQFYNAVEDVTNIGRDSFADRFHVDEAEVAFVSDIGDAAYPLLGGDTQIAILKVRITNVKDQGQSMGVLNELRLLDKQGRLYVPSWVQYPEEANEFIRTTPNIRISIFNPDTPQYRYIIFLVPRGIMDLSIVSTDKTLNQEVPIVPIEDLVLTGPVVPEEATPMVTPSTGQPTTMYQTIRFKYENGVIEVTPTSIVILPEKK